MIKRNESFKVASKPYRAEDIIKAALTPKMVDNLKSLALNNLKPSFRDTA